VRNGLRMLERRVRKDQRMLGKKFEEEPENSSEKGSQNA
jgi:hypothetical protein